MRIGKLRLTAGRVAVAISIVALVFALGGAAIGKKKKKGFKLRNGSVTTPKLADGAVTTPKIANGAVTTPKLADNEQSKGFVTHQAGAIALPAATDTTVATLNLPSGFKYAVTAHASIGPNAATAEIVSCALKSNGTTLSQGFGNTPALAVFSAEPVAAGIADGGTVTLTCNPDAASQAKERVILATRVGTAETQ
jgi:hypothetical protein